MNSSVLISLVAQAIAEMNDAPVCNPGALRWWANLPTAADGLVAFESYEDGWEALCRQVENNVMRRGLTFYEFFAGRRGDRGMRYRGFAPHADAHECADFVIRFIRRRARIPAWINAGVQMKALVKSCH